MARRGTSAYDHAVTPMSFEQPTLEDFTQLMLASGRFARVASDERERWERYALWSLAEEALGEGRAPEDAPPERVAEARAKVERYVLPRYQSADLWMIDDDAIVGALSVTLQGITTATAECLYVRPEHRRRGCASLALRVVASAAAKLGCLRSAVCAEWPLQRGLRFLLGRGLWVHDWKHSIRFVSGAGLPPHEVAIAEDGACLRVERGGRMQDLLHARRSGARLTVEPTPLMARCVRAFAARGALSDGAIAVMAESTLAIHLAAAGWPLIRSDEAWARAADGALGGSTEGLALAIQSFEEQARRDGWRVATPQVPGLRGR